MFPGGRYFKGRVPIEIDTLPICTTISQRRWAFRHDLLSINDQ